MKRYIAIVLSLIMCLSLFGCGRNTDDGEKAESIGDGQAVENVLSLEKETEGITESSVAQSEEPSDDLSYTVSSTLEESNLVTGQTSTSKTAVENVITRPQTQASTQTSAIIESGSSSVQKITCTVEIECKEILNHSNKFKKDISIVPQDGIILATTSVTADEGATAYDILKSVCMQNGISLNEKNSSFGKYIAGIGGIDEKDCGNTSGWVYTVNGRSPSVALDKYKLKNGDSLQLSYVC